MRRCAASGEKEWQAGDGWHGTEDRQRREDEYRRDPYGPLRVQVLAPGFQTFGEDYEIGKPELEITVKLKRPRGQYSLYEGDPAKADDKKPPAQKPQ